MDSSSPSRLNPAQIAAIFGPDGLIRKHLPRYEVRRSQEAMAEAVADALSHKHHVLIEAGTGTGKTLAYLVPAALSGKKVVISTGTKNLQEQLIKKDLPLVQKLFGGELRVALMKGRANYFCHYRFQKNVERGDFLLPDDRKWHEKILNWSRETEVGDRVELSDLADDNPIWARCTATSDNCLVRKCPAYSKCFYYKTKEIAAKADLIVVNHYLYFADIAVRSGGSEQGVIPNHDVVIFDEGHSMEDAATDYLGVSISNYRFKDLIDDVNREVVTSKAEAPTIAKALTYLGASMEQMFGYFQNLQDKKRLRREDFRTGAEESAAETLQQMKLLRAGLSELKDVSEEVDTFRERVVALEADLQFVVAMNDPEYVYWAEPLKRGAQLRASPINIGEDFRREVLEKFKSVVVTSATLSTAGNFGYISRRLGFPEETESLILQSPFSFAEQSVLYVPKAMPRPQDSSFAKAAAVEMERLVNLAKGRAFLLFTSYRMMDLVFKQLGRNLDYPVFLQGTRPRHVLLEAFRKAGNGVLFATSSFWQGVDVQGSELSLVVIDKLPFASPGDPITEARIDYLKERNEEPFMNYQVPEAVLTLKQGLGRLIRHREDTGILAVLDQRLVTMRYGKIFLNSLPGCPLVTDYDVLVRDYRHLVGG